jgi:hypothetical protein
MNLVIEDKQFPLWLVPKTPVSDQRLERLRDANQTLCIDRESSGELHISISSKSPHHPVDKT